ncbi:beta-amyrin 28-monooxygenase-like [Quercus lobata]|uniref:Cytochrome P450 n=1 Tax=Quercus lobata TaxID=97700 RepID=A0A7N2LL26_QUELO|nr:beta-amyrin 28-monooxygenase-like [Quercus lobata]
MDFFPNLFHLVFLCISFSLIFLIFKQKSTRAKLPPGKTGWPVIGETLEFAMAGTPETFIKDRMSKYSRYLFKTSMFGENMAVFCGASGNKFLFTNEKKYVISWWPRSVEKVMFSPETLENFVPEDYITIRRAIVEFLKLEALQHFIPIMDSMAKEHLETNWSPYGQVKVLPLSMKYTFAFGCRLFMSITDRNYVAILADPFAQIKDGLMSLPINIPGTSFNRAFKAGKVIHQKLLEVIQQRKKENRE